MKSLKPTDKDGKKRLLAAQMREKAAATAAARKQKPSSVTSAKSISAGISQPQSSNKASNKKSTPQRSPKMECRSPMDTYEISDDEKTYDSDNESQRPKKRIPAWVKRDKLIPALEFQYEKSTYDPDEIFGEVQTCNLEAIFGGMPLQGEAKNKKRDYEKRTSSGNWTKDRATVAEKLAYKRAIAM